MGQPDDGRSNCAACGRTLQISPPLVTFGRAYLLNSLDGLVAAAALDAVAADRIREIVVSELETTTGRSVRATVVTAARPATVADRATLPARPVPVRLAPSPQPAGPSFVETFFTPERAPSLLLYLGAFLVVVAALIFVNVSGQQISDTVRLVLMIVGTLGFLGGGLLCHRIPRVREAGQTFLVVGALLVPLDFGAYYALISRVSPFTSPAMWVLGSVVAAGLYAALAITAFGRAYSYLFYIASLSALAGLGVLLDLNPVWFLVPFMAYALGIQLVARTGNGRMLPLVAPLDIPASFVTAAVVILGAITAVVIGVSRTVPFAEGLGVPALALLATAFYVARTDRDHKRERWLATAGPAAIVFGLLSAAGAPAQTYGFVSGLLAIAYALACELSELAGVPSPFPMWARHRARLLGYLLIAGAFVPLLAYWRAPLVGAATSLGMALLLASLAVWRASPARRDGAVADLSGLVIVGAAALHLGVMFLLVATGLTQAGTAFGSGLEPRVLALGFVPIAAGLGVFAALARRRIPRLANAVSLASLASALIVVGLAFPDAPLASALATAATIGATATAVDSRRPSRLWIAAAFAAAAAVAAGRWLQPLEEFRPLGLAAAALILFVPAYLPRIRANVFAAVIREIAIAAALAGVGVGLGFALARSLSVIPWDTASWLATAPVLSVFGALAVIEGLHRRSERVVLFATASFLASVLIVVARLHPAVIEAYTLPLAIYLGLAAWGIARFGSPALRADLGLAAQLGAAVALVGPTYLRSWEQEAVARTLVVLAESVILLWFASARGLRELAAVSIGALALVVVRGAAAPLVLESSTAAFGVIAVALLLAAPRIPWRVGVPLREIAEVVGVLLVLVPPLIRTTAFGDDALNHGASVLAGGVVIVALGLWSGRRALVGTAGALVAATGALALRDAARAEPFVAATGAAVLALLLAIPRYVPRRLPATYEMALEILAVGLVVSGGIEQTLAAPFGGGEGQGARVLAESIALLGIGLASSRRALATSGLGAVAVMTVWVMIDPAARQFHGIAAGAALIAITLAAVRYAPRVLNERALIGAEVLGATLFLAPTLLSSWSAPFVPATILVFFEVGLLLAVGVLLRRRWLVAGALAVVGLEAIRGMIDVVNRLPNWALFGGSGALLLTAGFVLLLKREAWNAWSRRAYSWWARL